MEQTLVFVISVLANTRRSKNSRSESSHTDPLSLRCPHFSLNRPLPLRSPPFYLFPTKPGPFPSVAHPSPYFPLNPTPSPPLSAFLPISYSNGPLSLRCPPFSPFPLRSPAESFLSFSTLFSPFCGILGMYVTTSKKTSYLSPYLSPLLLRTRTYHSNSTQFKLYM